jgi:Protein of unknown function (DUF3302)
MESGFDALDAATFVVFGVLITLVVVIIVSLGQLPGQVARKRAHPQAAAISVAGWIGLAAGGVLWPLALIWAFLAPDAGTARRGGGETRP